MLGLMMDLSINNGRIEKMKGTKYVVAYWKENDDATDFDISIYQQAA